MPAGHMRFVPSHKQTDNVIDALPLAKWHVELVLISNEADRNAFLALECLHDILSHAVQKVCKLDPGQITLYNRMTPPLVRSLRPS